MIEKELSKKERVVVGTITSLGLVTVYTTGVSLSKTYPQYHTPIFTGTVIVSLISPYVLNHLSCYTIKKLKKKEKIKKLNK